MTYGQIFKEFTAQFPDIKVSDYRPARLPFTIIVWTEDNRCFLYHYDDFHRIGFIIGGTKSI